MSPTKLWSRDASAVWRGDCLSAEHVATVMGDRKAGALVFDAPYSDRTHSGHDSQHNEAPDGGPRDNKRRIALGLEPNRNLLGYAAWGPSEVALFCGIWIPRSAGWIVTVTDNTLAPIWAAEFEAAGLYPFAPIPLVEIGSRVRMAGDGPSSWTCWIVVARPRGKDWATWGTLPGAYVVPRMQAPERVVGGKPLLAMQCIVADYSRRGDLVVDPVSGGGTTGRAALAQGREFIGMEQDEVRAALTVKACAAVNVSQLGMFEETGT